MQAMNVMCGGTLHQDIAGSSKEHGEVPKEYDDKVKHRHIVELEPDSCCEKIFGTDEIITNSIHHQSCDKIGEGLKVTARAKDGVVEGIQSTTDWLAIGVQWHPELMDDPVEFFGDFVELVKSHRESHDRRSES
jgi:putative glutamine amidotransferase